MKYIKICFIAIFVCVITAFFVLTIDNNKEVSELEKRTLQTFPEFSIEKLAGEEYYSQRYAGKGILYIPVPAL